MLNFGPHNGRVSLNSISFFQTHFIPYFYSSVVVYSFYLGEVSRITANSIAGLNVFKWPAIVFCAGIFVIEIVIGSLFASFPGGLDYNQILLILYCSYAIVMGSSSLLLAWGTISLTRSLVGAGKSAFCVRVVVVNALMFLSLWCSSSFIWMGVSGLNLNSRSYWVGYFSPLWIGVAVIGLAIAFSFRVSVQKEIEISKSGTSSTSSTSKSSSSSSSSSDPVIEL